ncbi:MAG: hypothetical protein VX519_00595 [Myxococcota bacterium]|nr:hypothetical protein [Myxococcota bacterium]
MNPTSIQIAEFTWHAPKAGAPRWAIVDNNGDGLIDCDDPICCEVPDCSTNSACN